MPTITSLILMRLRAAVTVALVVTLLLVLVQPDRARAEESLADQFDVASLYVDDLGLSRVIVQYEDGALGADLLDDLTDLGVTRALELRSIDAVAVTAPAVVIGQVLADARVTGVHEQRRIESHLYASKEQVNAVGIEEAEAYTASIDGQEFDAERPGVDGTGVVIAIMDSGIFAPHPDFGSRVVGGLHFAFSEIQDSGGISYEDWDAYAELTGPLALQDDIGHGTHVASIAAGDGAASEFAGGPPLAGVAPGADLLSIKVVDAPFGLVEDIDWEEAALAGFDYLIRHPELGVRVVNNSWGLLPAEPDCLGTVIETPLAHCGETTDFDGMAEMFQRVIDAGITLVFSSGNSGPDFDTIGHYHRAGLAILVGAACKSVDGCAPGEVTEFSSRGLEDGTGPQVDVVAPGDHIMAALSPSVLVPLTNCPETQQLGYYCHSGTSMSSPHVSGVIALMYEANTDLTPAEVKACLTSTAVDMLEPGKDVASGHGMVDARAAVECAHTLTLTAPAGGDGGDEVVDPAPDTDADVDDDAADPDPASLPATGGGLALAGLLALGASRLGRRRAA